MWNASSRSKQTDRSTGITEIKRNETKSLLNNKLRTDRENCKTEYDKPAGASPPLPSADGTEHKQARQISPRQ